MMHFVWLSKEKMLTIVNFKEHTNLMYPKRTVLSAAKPRDATVNFDRYGMCRQVFS